MLRSNRQGRARPRVEVRPVCVNASRWDCTLEPTDREDRFAVRLGFAWCMASPIAPPPPWSRHGRINRSPRSTIFGGAPMFLSPPWSDRRGGRLPALSRTRPSRRSMGDQGAARRTAAALRLGLGPRGETVPEILEPIVALRPMTPGGEVVEDYGHVGLSLRHSSRVLPARRASAPAQRYLRRPCGRETGAGSRSPALFSCDRGGHGQGRHVHHDRGRNRIANLIVWPSVYERQRRVILSAACSGSVAGPARRRHRPYYRPWLTICLTA